ncbi:MAG: ATP-dependent Clp protease proteolytic subunit [Clostridia bacterium]|nr:ATP-dependent Clp protease proteolytic subunit [Clostridia bacterium]
MQLENIVRSGAVISRRKGFTIHTLTIIGQIEGHYQTTEGQKSTKYEHLIPMLVAAENSEAIDGLLIILNTMGGDVEAGLAISELIAGMKTPTVSLVLGGGHSIGVPLAVSADRSFIVPSATMTLHPVRTNGLVLGVYQSFTYFHKMQERIVRFIADHSSISGQRLQELMLKTDQIPTDMGSVIEGEQAVKEGLIDRVGGIHEALEELEALIRQNKTQ